MNIINWRDVWITVVVAIIVILGFVFEFAGETAKNWHTISWWANRNKWLRWFILAVGLVLLLWLVFIHFASNGISR